MQQHLVALVVNLQLARQLADSDPTGARRLLDEIGDDLQTALEGVRELAARIYPPLLVDRGLGEAVKAAAAGAPVTTAVDATALDRHPPAVEAAVYATCVAALEDAAARGAVRADVRLWSGDGALGFEVSDDGPGSPGHAVAETRDRLSALGGRLALEGEPGRGARVSGTVPVAP